MSIQIKGPNADDIFNRFKQKADKKSLEKHYGVKKAVFNIDNITAAEYVKSVTKEAVFFFEVNVNIKPSGKDEVIKAPYKNMEKEKFYDLPKTVNKEDWKGEDTVPMNKTIQSVQCSTCGGTGKKQCKNCGGKGTIECSDCKGTGFQKCNHCSGKGEQFFEVIVFNENNKRIEKRKISMKCPDCFGTGKITCHTCAGLKRMYCKTCDSIGSEKCENCGGVGNLWEYKILPVPFKELNGKIPVLIPSIKTNIEKEMGKSLSELIEKINGITLKNIKELDKKIIEPNLGYYEKTIDKALKQTTSELKDYDKKDGHKPIYPVHLFPLIILECLTPKNKKYNVYSVGSDRGFIVFGELP